MCLCVCVCDLSVSVRIWHGGHIAAGGRIFPQQRGGHLLPGAGCGLQWICYIRLVEIKHNSVFYSEISNYVGFFGVLLSEIWV